MCENNIFRIKKQTIKLKRKVNKPSTVVIRDEKKLKNVPLNGFSPSFSRFLCLSSTHIFLTRYPSNIKIV